MVTNIELNNNVIDNDSNIDKSKEEELPFSLNTVSDEKVNEENESNTNFKFKNFKNQILSWQSC